MIKSSRSRSARGLGLVLVPALLLTVAAVLGVKFVGSGGHAAAAPASGSVSSAQPGKGDSGPRYHIDHATFLAVNDLAGQSSSVILGTVESSKPGGSTSLGVDPSTGKALPALPHTDFLVRVNEAMKGTAKPGSVITIALAGGVTDVGPVTVDGVPVLPINTPLLFFVFAGDDGKYYPLAGGAAIATQQPSGTFVLPDEVTGSSSLTFNAAQVLVGPNTVHLVVTTHPVINLNGAVQSGGLVRTPETDGAKSMLTGEALVAGSVISANLSIVGDAATGSFSVDGVEFTIVNGRAVGTSSKVAHITGAVAQVGAGGGQPTTNANLDVVIQ